MNEKGLPPILKILPFPPRNMKICGFPLFSRIFFDTIWFFPNSSRIKHLFLEIASKLLNKERRKTTHIKALFQIFRAGSITTCQLFWNPSRNFETPRESTLTEKSSIWVNVFGWGGLRVEFWNQNDIPTNVYSVQGYEMTFRFVLSCPTLCWDAKKGENLTPIELSLIGVNVLGWGNQTVEFWNQNHIPTNVYTVRGY